MPAYYRHQDQDFPLLDEQVRIGVDRTTKAACLLLTNTPFLFDRTYETGRVLAFIGVVNQPGGGWRPIQPGECGGMEWISQTTNFTDPDAILAFQQAVVKAWDALYGKQAADPGRSPTSVGFVAKALNAGYAANRTPMPTSRRIDDWSIDDLLKYANRRAMRFQDPALIGFEAHGASPAYDNEDTERLVKLCEDPRDFDYIRSAAAKTHKGRFAYDQELGEVNGRIPFERVIGYGFRGDKRPPGVVKGAGGFLPNYTRPDQIERQRIQLEGAIKYRPHEVKDLMAKDQEALHLQKHIQDADYRAFISVSKSVRTAKAFATAQSANTGGPYKVDGWVYACFVEGAFHLPRKGEHDWAVHDEGELAMPGMLDWEDVVGCRRVTKDNQFDGPVYLRRGLHMREAQAARQIYEYLSGRIQPVATGKVPTQPSMSDPMARRRLSLGMARPQAAGLAPPRPKAPTPGLAPPRPKMPTPGGAPLRPTMPAPGGPPPRPKMPAPGGAKFAADPSGDRIDLR